MNNEVFKDVLNYEGLYQVSNYGRIKSLKRESIFYCGLKKKYLKRQIKEKILKIRNGVNNYKIVCLTKNGISKSLFVHRLVAQAFIPNPENKPQVNHKDGNKHNNKVNNLEWVTSKENNKHAFENGLNKSHNQRKVKQYSINGKYIKTWSSITEYLKHNNISIRSGNITSCCKGRKKSAYGYKWKYKE